MSEIYFKFKSKYETEKQRVNICEICNIWHKDFGNIEMTDVIPFKEKFKPVGALLIIQKLCAKYPDCTCINLGAQDITLCRPPKKSVAMVLLTVALCIILFFGGAIGIMSFSLDTSLNKTLADIHYRFTGNTDDSFFISIPFAVGISLGFLGILQIFKKKLSPPSLFDLDLNDFETQVNQYISKLKE